MSKVHLAHLLIPSTLTLATCGPDGEPHAAPVYFAAEGILSLEEASITGGLEIQPDLQGMRQALRLYFFSAAESQHGQDIARDPRAAVALYPESERWQDIRGLQMRGEVQAIDPGPQWDQAWKHYQAKFSFVKALQPVVARNRLYVFIPRWVRLIDNRQGFGYKQEWVLP